MSIFSESKDAILSLIEDGDPSFLRFPIKKLHTLFNGYSFGDLVVIGGRKTGGRGTFVMGNYVIAPLIQHHTKENKDKNLKVIYFNNRHTTKFILEKMAVNYISQKAGGNKLSIAALYRMEGAQHKLPLEKSKDMVSKVFDFFHRKTTDGTLSLIPGKRSILEIEAYVERVMEEYGTFNDLDDFTFNSEEAQNIILVIDDISGMTKGASAKGDTTTMAMKVLQDIAKKYDILVVVSAPVSATYFRDVYKSNTEELMPYINYADKALVLHNPLETDMGKFIGYTTEDWINAKTGICYLRSAFVAANSMGVSGVYVPLFMYPENGYFKQLPKADNLDDLYAYMDLVTK